MATKRVCDRCGAEINPYNSVTYAGMRRVKNDINDNDYELCVSCAHELRKWFNGEENDKGITYCGACADYDIKKHRCKRGAKLESNPQDKFF